MGMKFLAQGHKIRPGWGSNPRPCDQESDALPNELSVLPIYNRKGNAKVMVCFGDFRYWDLNGKYA